MGLTRAIILVVAVAASVPATAGNDETINVFNQLSVDYMECSAYYIFSKQCAPVTATPDELAKVQGWAEAAENGAYTTGKAIGMSDEALKARMKLSVESVAALADGKCVNYSVLLVKYGDFCRDLAQDPTARAKAICEQLYPNQSSMCEQLHP